jgi:hypothetical protein
MPVNLNDLRKRKFLSEFFWSRHSATLHPAVLGLSQAAPSGARHSTTTGTLSTTKYSHHWVPAFVFLLRYENTAPTTLASCSHRTVVAGNSTEIYHFGDETKAPPAVNPTSDVTVATTVPPH